MKLNQSQIRHLLAPVYYDACLSSEVKMKELSEILENIADIFGSTDSNQAFNRLRLNRLQLDTAVYRSYLIKLKKDFYNQLPAVAENIIKEAFAGGYKQGLKIWQEEYFNALSNFNGIVYSHLCNTDYGFDKKQQENIKRYKVIHKLLLDQRWNDIFPFYCELFGDDRNISRETRSKFAVIAGQIVLYNTLPEYERAKEYFDIARKIYQGSAAESATGEYYIKVRQYDKARDAFLTAISHEPNEVRNYLLMGDSYLNEFRFDAAEQWYTDALNINFLDTEIYHRLILLNGYPDVIKSKPGEIERLVKSAEEIEIVHSYENYIYNLYRNAGLAYSYSYNYEKSLKYYQSAIDMSPDFSMAYIDKAYILTYNKQYDEAEESFRKTLSFSDQNFETFWGLAYLYQQKSDYKKAIDCYLKCLELYPSGKETLYSYLGDCYQLSQDYNKAEEYFKKALKLKHDLKNFDKLKGLFEKSGESDKLEKLLLEGLDQNLSNPLYYNDIGIFYYNKGDFSQAIRYYSKSIELNDTEPVYHENIGLAFEKSGDLGQAEKSFLKALSCKINEGIYANRLGYFYFEQHEYGKSLDYYSLALEKEPEVPLYYENIALAYEMTGKYSEAIENYEKALKINPENAIVLNRIGLIHYNHQRYDQAINYYRRAVVLDQKSWIYLSNLGLALRLSGKTDEAIEVYQKAVNLKEDDYFNWNELGVLFYEKVELDKAIECYNKAISIKPDDPIYFDNIALAYAEKGMVTKAIENYEKALKMNPENADILNRIGLIYNNQKQYDLAINYYRKALILDNSNWIYLSNLGLALRLSGKIEEAIEVYQKTLSLKDDDYFNWNELGVLFYEKGELDKSVECYNKSISIQSDITQIYVNLALALNKQGKTEDVLNITDKFHLNPEVKKNVESTLKQEFPLIFNGRK